MYPTNPVNLAQAKVFSLRQEGSLAQTTNSRLGKTAYKRHVVVSLKLAYLAHARLLSLMRDYSRSGEWPSLRRALEPERKLGRSCSRSGKSSSLKRELFILSNQQLA